jgi:hypothetical protein
MEKHAIQFVHTTKSMLLHDFEHELAGLFNGECFLLGKKGKGKVIPLQAWTGPEGSRRFPDFETVGK